MAALLPQIGALNEELQMRREDHGEQLRALSEHAEEAKAEARSAKEQLTAALANIEVLEGVVNSRAADAAAAGDHDTESACGSSI